MNTVDCLRTDKTMPRKKYLRMSKARQTVEDAKTLSSEVGVLKLSDGGLSQPKTPSVSLEMGVMKISDGGNAQPKKPSVSVEMGVMKISDGGNAQPKNPSVSLEMGVMNLSDGGNAQPAKPSVSEIADIVIDTLPETLKIPDTLNEPLNVPLNEHMPHTLSELMPNAVSKTNTEIHLVPDTLINTMPETDVTHNHSYSFAHNDTHHCSHNDSHSIPHSDFHSTPLACDKSFAVQFIESSGNDCLKTQIDFDIAFAEAFPNIVVKRQTCYNEELTENKEVAYIELIESNETSFCDSHFEIIDTDDQVATKPLFKSLIASDSSNSQTSFDVVFLDNFPEVAANYQSRDNELSERERIAFCPVNTSQQNEELKRNVTAQHQLSIDPLEVCSDNDVACYQAVRSSELLWNASDLVFGSFHQNDGRFSEHSRGYQCTCNALCMLSYAHCGDVDNSMVLDKVLYEGDALYQAVIRKLKSDGKLSQHLLSLEEIPDNFEVEIGKFTLEKFHIESGPLIDTQDIGLPTLHEVLQSAFLSVSSGLLTVGAICSAVFKKKGAYAFFDSHCHGHNGLSAADGASSLITFSSLDDLVRYMYAFYDSMKLDTSMQYDFLPINIKKSENKQSYKDEMVSHMEAYFKVGNIDTLVDDADIDNKYDKVFTFAPGEGHHPLSLYQDKDAEYLCFPTIFCGQTPPSRDERLVPVHYSDIVKWELRSVDRRAAQSVPNIFFKHKKLQMKQISDKVNLAVRRCKKRGKKITAAEARDSNYLDKLVNLDEGYYIFRQLRNSPAYLETRKKDIFAMIRQLSLPTWFMSLSAADTRWTDMLKMLAKLNDGIEYSEKELEHLTWQEKTKLVQKDPVTCSRYFDHRVQEFLNTVLKSSCEPIGKLLDFFYRVEFQQRGSPHIHMLVWIENASTLETHSEEEIVQFVDQYLTSKTDNEKTANLVGLQSHKHSKTCRKKGKPICTRFIQKVPGLLPLLKCLVLDPNKNYMWRKMNTRPLI